MHPRRAAECIDADAAVVGEAGLGRQPARMARLGEGVLDECRMRLFGVGNAEIPLPVNLDP